MKTDKQKLKDLIDEKLDQIKRLREEVKTLQIQEVKTSDDNYTFVEEERVFEISKRPKKFTEPIMCGIGEWTEYFWDESTGEKYPIKRSAIIFEGKHLRNTTMIYRRKDLFNLKVAY